MEAVLATLAVVLLMIGALALLARSWPRSSHLGGYRAWTHAGSPDRPAQAQERGDIAREDDDVRWHWVAPDDERDR
jgi:hypothetical protein